jgi:S-(hydroxymethyl)glutathione dehydrogenase/alcohol dehydrogenase
MLIELYTQKKLNLDDLITRRYTLEQINQAYADLLDGKLARGVIVM